MENNKLKIDGKKSFEYTLVAAFKLSSYRNPLVTIGYSTKYGWMVEPSKDDDVVWQKTINFCSNEAKDYISTNDYNKFKKEILKKLAALLHTPSFPH